MYYLTKISDFFLTTWLWNITFGITQPIIGAIILFFILYLVRSNTVISAMFYSFGSYTTAFLIIGCLAKFFGYYAYDIYYPITTVTQQTITIKALQESIKLALIYCVLQLIFFLTISNRHRHSIVYYCTVIIIVNLLASYINYSGICALMWYSL